MTEPVKDAVAVRELEQQPRFDFVSQLIAHNERLWAPILRIEAAQATQNHAETEYDRLNISTMPMPWYARSTCYLDGMRVLSSTYANVSRLQAAPSSI